MKKVVLVYAPFCTPASPPYSITNLYCFLKKNGVDAEMLDLNIKFHDLKFGSYKDYFQNFINKYDANEYNNMSKKFIQETKEVYMANNKKVVDSLKPELFDEFFEEIIDKKPSIVAFSIVYSSQCFYAYALLKKLKRVGVKTVIGGPAVNEILSSVADKTLKNEVELLEEVSNIKDVDVDIHLNFSIYNPSDYFVPALVIPIKTSSTCFYQKCAFCTHYTDVKYCEYGLDGIKKTIAKSKAEYFFLIDDNIHKKRLLEISSVMKGKWCCQLKPTKDWDFETLKRLNRSGLKMIMWGVESGSDGVLGAMRKGTNTKDVAKVLLDSHNAGIKNIVYVMFGFPGETKEEFLETIDFLKRNSLNIDLISTTTFGLQKGSAVYENPSEFGISKVIETKRTVLEPKLSYEVENGLTQEDAKDFRQKYKKTLEGINKYPKGMNFFREHMLILS
jgi:hypothetical protein